jgi:hypothetical protein
MPKNVMAMMRSGSSEKRLIACPNCGEPCAWELNDGHVCELERRYDYELIKRHFELKRFQDELEAWLDSPEGRFESWCAAKSRS